MFSYFFFRLKAWIKDVLWKAEFPAPEETDELEIFEKIQLYRGSTFDDIFIHNHVEAAVSVEILKLFLLNVCVSCLVYSINWFCNLF